MSYFRPAIDRMSGYVPGEQPQDNRYIKLNTNENPYPPAPAAVKALRRMDAEKLRKYPPPLADGFRHEAAKVLGVRPEMILAGNGSDDLLTIIARSFAGKDDLIAYPWPTYSLYPVLAQLQEARTEAVPFGPDFALPQRLADLPAKIVFIANPNSPTGTMIPPSDLAWLADRISGVLVIDEAYVDFADCNCLDLTMRHGNVIVLRTLSKSYSLAGVRFGLAVADPELIAGMAKVKDSYNCDAVAIQLATVAIGQQQYLAQVVAKIRRQRLYLTRSLRKLGFEVLDSQANFIWAVIHSMPAGRIYEDLKQRGILVRYFDEPPLQAGLRITVGKPRDNQQLVWHLRSIITSS